MAFQQNEDVRSELKRRDPILEMNFGVSYSLFDKTNLTKIIRVFLFLFQPHTLKALDVGQRVKFVRYLVDEIRRMGTYYILNILVIRPLEILIFHNKPYVIIPPSGRFLVSNKELPLKPSILDIVNKDFPVNPLNMF